MRSHPERFQEKNGFDSLDQTTYYIRNGYIRENDSAMSMTESNIEKMLPLTPAVFHVLLALVEGERHGYAIMQEVAEGTAGRIHMGPGTLYGTIKRLLEARLIEESDRRPDPELDDERRRYYRLTGLGRQVVKAEALRYEQLTKLARRKKLLRLSARVGQVKGV
jgi:DNA-binding PadR family transcriptional regulator